MLCYATLEFVENDQEYKPCSNQERFAMMDRKNINDEYANVKRFPFAAVINEKT